MTSASEITAAEYENVVNSAPPARLVIHRGIESFRLSESSQGDALVYSRTPDGRYWVQSAPAMFRGPEIAAALRVAGHNPRKFALVSEQLSAGHEGRRREDPFPSA